MLPASRSGKTRTFARPSRLLGRRRATSSPPLPAPAPRRPGPLLRKRNRPRDGRESPPLPRPCRPAGGGRCRGSRRKAGRPAAPRRGAGGSSPQRPRRCRRALRGMDRAPRRSRRRPANVRRARVIRKHEETRPTPGCGPTAAKAARSVAAVVASAPMTAPSAAPQATSAQARCSRSPSRRSISSSGRPRAASRFRKMVTSRGQRGGGSSSHSGAQRLASKAFGRRAPDAWIAGLGKDNARAASAHRFAQPDQRIAQRSRPITTAHSPE